MSRNIIAALAIILLLTFVVMRFWKNNADPAPADTTNPSVATLGYSIINTYPHNPQSFTQGLMLYKGELYEGTGMNGQSKLMKVDIATGKSLQEVKLDSVYFGEGITILNDTVYQLTWQNKKVFVYTLKDFKLVRELSIPTEGWGLTSDGTHMIVSDGSNNLYYYHPNDFSLVKTVPVSEAGVPAFNLNELEYVNGFIYANQWQYPYILKIDPASGEVVSKMDLSDIVRRVRSQNPQYEFLNGIAYDSTTNRFLVTGKYWPNLFEIQVAE